MELGLDNILTDPTTSKLIVISSVIGFIILLIITTGLFTYYTSTTDTGITPDQQSKSRLTVLDEVFRSIMGNNYPYVLLIMVILLIISLVFLYMNINTNFITVNMSDKASKIFNISMIIFMIILSVFMVVLALKYYLDYKNESTNSSIPNYIPYSDQKTKNLEIVSIVGVVLFILMTVGAFIWYQFMKN